MKILALFDYNSFTGFATVSKNLVTNWKAHYGDKMELHIVAVNYFGEDYTEGNNVKIISAKKSDIAKDDFGRYVFLRTLQQQDYDLIFILQDLGVISPAIPYINGIKKEKQAAGRKVFKSLFYFPVDFDLTPNLGKGLDSFDCLITYTEYGKHQVLKLRPNLQKKLFVIPHGNNPDDFYPISDEERADFRKDFFGNNADKFIITNVNRNQSRKDIPNTIFGFIEYKREYNPHSFLYLHMNPNDPMGWDLKTILSQTGLIEGVDYGFQNQKDTNKGTPIFVLNAIYNASDVFVSTTTGEGWGLSITEAMATKTPILVPNHTSVAEIAKGGERGYMLTELYPVVAMVDNVIRWQSDLYQIAESLDFIQKEIKANSQEHSQKVQNAYDYVTSLNWTVISKEFIKHMNRIFHS